MLILYRASIALYGVLISIFSLFNDKAKKFKSGRKNIFERLKADFKGNEQPIWVHVASLGEFEQGRPIIEAIKKEHPNTKILLTFFSPSGYEIRKNYPLADWVYYLPLDTPKNAKKFIATVQPKMAIFIKYEFWYYFLKELHTNHIPTLLVSAIFRKKQFFFHWSGQFFHKVLKPIHHYFVQDEKSLKLIQQISSNATVVGDTRFDRVIEISNQAKQIEKVDAFVQDKKVMVLGSTWQSDIEVIKEFIQKYQSNIKFIIAPHNIGKSEIDYLQNTFSHTTTYSSTESPIDKQILIIDNIGMLSSIYKYADFVFIGGGFRGALHNTLEAAVYGVPLFFGRNEKNTKFIEAGELEEIGVAFPFETVAELTSAFNKLNDDETFYQKCCEAGKTYVQQKSGATELVMQQIRQIWK